MFIKRPRRLILLVVSDDPSAMLNDDSPTTDALRQYVRQQTYIDYKKDKNWLDKLLYALPVTGMLKTEEESENLLQHTASRIL